MKHWTIYSVTNALDGKQYIGLTNDIRERRYAHLHGKRSRSSSVLQRAMNKHGVNCFEFASVASCLSSANACYVEKLLIKERSTKAPNGYNMTDGGEGAWGYKQSPETIEKRVRHIRGKKRSPEVVARQAAALRGFKHSDEVKKRMSEAQLLSKSKQSPMTPEQRKAISDRFRGKKRDPELMAKINAAQRGIPRPYARELRLGEVAARRHEAALMFMEYAGMY
jgi:group I intron endonuclease